MAAYFHFSKHDDPGNSRLSDAPGALIALLDVVLGTGNPNGWEKVFSGTNKAVYRPRSGLRYYLRVDDTIGQYAQVRCYESMTDVDTGSSPFPTTGQRPDFIWRKNDGNVGNGHWIAVASSRFLVLGVYHSNSSTVTTGDLVFCGEIPQGYLAGDADVGAFYIRARISTTGAQHIFGGTSVSSFNATSGFAWQDTYAARGTDGITPSALQSFPVYPPSEFNPDASGNGVPYFDLPSFDANRTVATTNANNGNVLRARRLPHLYFTGLSRNPNGFAWDSSTKTTTFPEIADPAKGPTVRFRAVLTGIGNGSGVHWLLEVTDTQPEVP